jgi:hypothetical protein
MQYENENGVACVHIVYSKRTYPMHLTKKTIKSKHPTGLLFAHKDRKTLCTAGPNQLLI